MTELGSISDTARHDPEPRSVQEETLKCFWVWSRNQTKSTIKT